MRKKTKPHMGESGARGDAAPTLTTYSIRLSESERAHLARALEVKGWTATHFIRQATLEKAAHVANTSRFTTFDFDHLARWLAKLMCEPPIKIRDPLHPEAELRDVDASAYDQPDPYPTTEPLTRTDIEEVRKAVRLGGTEFLKNVLDECDRLVMHQRVDLPSPVDPAKLG
jgi:uncharacterized protein (DUF1778 family)